MFSSEEDDDEEEQEQQSQTLRGDGAEEPPCSSSSQHLRGSSTQTDNNSSEQGQDDMEIEREEDEDGEEDNDEEEDEDEEDEEDEGEEEEEEGDEDDDDNDDEEGEGDGREEEDEEEEEENQDRSNTADDDGHRHSRADTTETNSQSQQDNPNSQTNNQSTPLPPSTTTTTANHSPSLNDSNSNQPSADQSTRLDLNSSGSALPNTYRQQILQRYQNVSQPRKFQRAPIIDPLVFIPHGCPVHALAIPPCGSHLFSGGQDGFVRRIAIHESVTGSALENLTMKQGGHVPLIEKDTDKTTIFLTGYWENEDHKSLLDPSQPTPPLKWGPKSVGNATQVSPVYSLAIHNEELWGLSGTESGNINLFTIRHDEGHIRHVFKAANPPSVVPLTSSSDVRGHKPGSVISSLALNSDQNVAFSGGWDGIGWDLNTGQVVNKFIAHASQISTVSLRPDSQIPIYDTKFEENLLEREEEERRIDRSEQANDQELKKKNKDDDEDTEMKTVESVEVSQAPSQEIVQEKTVEPTASSSPDRPLASDIVGDEDSEEDGSLFGGADNSGSEGEGSPEASVPLATLNPERAKGGGNGGGLILPTASGSEKPVPTKPAAPPLILPTVATSKPRNVVPVKPVLPATNLTQVPSVLDSSLPVINDDVLMTSGIDGQVYLWDRRVSGSGSHGYVRKLDLPKSTSPWTASASWSIDGRSVFVGRRNHSVDLYDLRFLRPSSPIFNPDAIQRSIKLPPSSGPVSCVKPWPDGNHLLCASFDNLRLYNLNADLHPTSLSSVRKSTHQPPKIPFKIIPGHSSGVVSQMCQTISKLDISQPGVAESRNKKPPKRIMKVTIVR
ncbi:Transcription factor spt8 [Puccinia graminis f. sp. tritici]|uniref:Transcription factor spt8 n=1 Tax=Puccinia graminis f. sp. tritici TaxID=56615 RepID=A0A5B0PDX3_PUCGR|nr:Transcription factor spt8 [Puccinia graminis f. sp. tritici]